MLLSDLSRARLPTPIVCDVLRPVDQAQALEEGASGADVILDASASRGGYRGGSRIGATPRRGESRPSSTLPGMRRCSSWKTLPALSGSMPWRRNTTALCCATARYRPTWPRRLKASGTRAAAGRVSARIPESRVSVLSGLAAGGHRRGALRGRRGHPRLVMPAGWKHRHRKDGSLPGKARDARRLDRAAGRRAHSRCPPAQGSGVAVGDRRRLGRHCRYAAGAS